MLKALEKDRLIVLFLSGLLMGMAFMMKQHSLFFIIFSILLCRQWEHRILWKHDTVNHQPNSQATIYIFERLIDRAAIAHFKEVLHSKAQRDSSRKHQYNIIK